MNTKAKVSIILGIISIVLLVVPFSGFIIGVIGLIFGIMGLQEIKQQEQVNKKPVMIGIVCNSMGILLPIPLIFIFYMAYTFV